MQKLSTGTKTKAAWRRRGDKAWHEKLAEIRRVTADILFSVKEPLEVVSVAQRCMMHGEVLQAMLEHAIAEFGPSNVSYHLQGIIASITRKEALESLARHRAKAKQA